MTAPADTDTADADAAAELHQRGVCDAEIAHQLGISRGAVPAYIAAGRRHHHELAHQDQLPLFD